MGGVDWIEIPPHDVIESVRLCGRYAVGAPVVLCPSMKFKVIREWAGLVGKAAEKFWHHADVCRVRIRIWALG